MNAQLPQESLLADTDFLKEVVERVVQEVFEALMVADIDTQEPMTPEVHQRIGSVTKTFTVSLLLQAAADGLLSLDDTIDRYV